MSVGKLFKQQEIQHMPTYATGFVSPKTTALFFDKIWVTDKFAKESSIPDQVRFFDPRSVTYEELYNIKEHQNAIVRYYPRMDESVLVNKDGSILDYKEFFCMLENEVNRTQSIERDKNNKQLNWIPNNRESKDSSYIRLIDALKFSHRGNNKYLTSVNRNEALRLIAGYYLQRGVHVVPIYHNTTDFEESLIYWPESKPAIPFNPAFITYYKNWSNPKKEINVIEAVVKSIPSVIEDTLTWQQVLDFRNDKDSFHDLIAFRSWASRELTGLTQAEITEYISECIINYEKALKKHGIQTGIGSLVTILSASSSLIEMLGEGQAGLIAAGLAVAATVMTYSVDSFFQYRTIKNEPIAYIYNISNLIH